MRLKFFIIFAKILDIMNKINKIFLILFLLIPFWGISQVDIKISFDNQQDSVFYFCKYRGAKAMVMDTLEVNDGVIRYKNKTKLPE